jgi:two-component system sensor histidine kinase DesK
MKERERFGRDLHDLLGFSLSAITLKAELVRRLVGDSPSRARDELADVLDMCRQAMAETRTVAIGYRNISLSKEASSASSLLSAAGVDTQVQVDCGALDEHVDATLATVLREAVTNVLRHSTATRCSIDVTQEGGIVRLHVINNGAALPSESSTQHSGLDNLRTRMETIGGRLTARLLDRHFDLLAEVPCSR